MFAIRNLAVKRGNVPSGVIAQARNLYETGRVINPVRSILVQREKFGLSRIPSTNIEDVQKILKKTALDKIIRSELR
jgi:heterodisulfide reductase subunit C